MRKIGTMALNIVLALAIAAGPAGADEPTGDAGPRRFDVVVYGGTSGGVTAAVQVARMGGSAALIEPGQHIGGLTSGGLGQTDVGRADSIGGMAREFYTRAGKHYGRNQAAFTFEPHVAEQIFNEMIRQAGPGSITVVTGQRLDRTTGVKMDGGRIVTIATEGGQVYAADRFIDATYEGDLMAAAGVTFTTGREANAKYSERLNGVQKSGAKSHQWSGKPVDPYVVPGKPDSGLLPGLRPASPGDDGSADAGIQAYNFRLCLTKNQTNRLPVTRPESYDPKTYELLARYLADRPNTQLRQLLIISRMPGGKTDMNNRGPFSTDFIGQNHDYPNADYARREQIVQAHRDYVRGLIWFLANDPRVPEVLRNETAAWGTCKDEFTDTGGWGHQLYVREARRMVSDYVMTEHDCRGRRAAGDSVGMASYSMDSHNVWRYVTEDGRVRNEGDIQVGVPGPYPVSYRAIVPRGGECTNLLVPVCVSASHVAYGSIRMEPVFMVLGQSAGTAAMLSARAKVDVQKLDYEALKVRLVANGQVLVAAQARPIPVQGIKRDGLEGIVVDNADKSVTTTGKWEASTSARPFVGDGYLHDEAAGGGGSVRFEATLPKTGSYEVRLYYSPNPNRATNATVQTHHAGGLTLAKVNQRESPPGGKPYVVVGRFRVEAGQAVVTVSNEGADGHVIADAVQWVPADQD